jgi:hypothetical protein
MSFQVGSHDPNSLLISRLEQGVATRLTMVQAEELLDWLENHGCTIVEVSHQESGMSVRYFYPGCEPVRTPPRGWIASAGGPATA